MNVFINASMLLFPSHPAKFQGGVIALPVIFQAMCASSKANATQLEKQNEASSS